MSLYNRDKRAEEILGSKGRIRVLEVLTESGELNISEVSRRTGLNYTSVERHLMKLKEMGLLNEKRYGKIRIFEIKNRYTQGKNLRRGKRDVTHPNIGVAISMTTNVPINSHGIVSAPLNTAISSRTGRSM